MANIHTKEHLFVMVKGKNGLERREVKSTRSDYKIAEKLKRTYEQGKHFNRIQKDYA